MNTLALIIGLIVCALIAACVIATARIPEGWEDDDGYHEGKETRKEDEKSC